ncbi:hypothetical protein ABZ208_10690 [Streptomyces sp. NPDC006208]|uniref:hypothetical protein n=1 Tax=Streptomyces sp. NPDC006208 TaxID=3156734 RepID=UPI0033A5A678
MRTLLSSTGPRKTAVLVLALALLAAAGLLVRAQLLRDGQLDDNRDRLRSACQGLLPHEELARRLPDDQDVVPDEYGTVLDPGQESRALLDCRLPWGAGREVRLRAEALLARQLALPGDSDGPFLYRLSTGAEGFVHRFERRGRAEAIASVLVHCPKGVRARGGRSTGVRVAVQLPADDRAADRLLAARTALSFADWVTGRLGCGAAALRTTTRAPAGSPPSGHAMCAWLDPERADRAAGRWTHSGSRRFTTWQNSCTGRREKGAPAPRRLELEGVETHSAAGALGRELYETEFFTGPEADPDGVRTFHYAGDGGTFHLYATSVCDGGPVHHRVSVKPHITYDDQGMARLTAADWSRITADTRAVFDRCMNADDGWPRRSHCRRTTVQEELS